MSAANEGAGLAALFLAQTTLAQLVKKGALDEAEWRAITDTALLLCERYAEAYPQDEGASAARQFLESMPTPNAPRASGPSRPGGG